MTKNDSKLWSIEAVIFLWLFANIRGATNTPFTRVKVSTCNSDFYDKNNKGYCCYCSCQPCIAFENWYVLIFFRGIKNLINWNEQNIFQCNRYFGYCFRFVPYSRLIVNSVPNTNIDLVIYWTWRPENP